MTDRAAAFVAELRAIEDPAERAAACADWFAQADEVRDVRDDAIRRLRAAGISQLAVAAIAGVGLTTVRNVEGR